MTTMKKALLMTVLAASAAVQAEMPLPEHPRPDWERAEWINLNGEWDFGFAPGKFDRKILVPFGWGSPASRVKDGGDRGYYQRAITVPSARVTATASPRLGPSASMSTAR